MLLEAPLYVYRIIHYSKIHHHPQGKQLGFLGVGAKIVRNESFWALYKGLGAVVAGIVPKMAIRFSSFELYKSWMADPSGKVSTTAVFFGKFKNQRGFDLLTIHILAGLAAGTTEAILVVSPMDLIKIRLQVNSHVFHLHAVA